MDARRTSPLRASVCVATVCGLQLPTFTSVNGETYVRLKAIKDEMGLEWDKRKRFLAKMDWKLGRDFEFEGMLFQDVPREVKRQEVWITVAALYKLMKSARGTRSAGRLLRKASAR